MHMVEEVIASDIRPYVELDAGGVSVQSVVQSKEVIIVYQGACTTCYSSKRSDFDGSPANLAQKGTPQNRSS